MGGPGDPANDLSNVTLTLPTPPPGVYHQQQQQQQQPTQQQLAQRQQLSLGAGMGEGNYPSRQIRPMPSRNRLASSTIVPRNVSITMGEPDSAFSPPQQQQQQGMLFSAPPTQGYASGFAQPGSSPIGSAQVIPMYGEDQVPMSVQLNGAFMPAGPPPQQQQQQHQPHSAPPAPINETSPGAAGLPTTLSPNLLPSGTTGGPVGLPTVQENPWAENSSEADASSPLGSLTA